MMQTTTNAFLSLPQDFDIVADDGSGSMVPSPPRLVSLGNITNVIRQTSLREPDISEVFICYSDFGSQEILYQTGTQAKARADFISLIEKITEKTGCDFAPVSDDRYVNIAVVQGFQEVTPTEKPTYLALITPGQLIVVDGTYQDSVKHRLITAQADPFRHITLTPKNTLAIKGDQLEAVWHQHHATNILTSGAKAPFVLVNTDNEGAVPRLKVIAGAELRGSHSNARPSTLLNNQFGFYARPRAIRDMAFDEGILQVTFVPPLYKDFTRTGHKTLELPAREPDDLVAARQAFKALTL